MVFISIGQALSWFWVKCQAIKHSESANEQFLQESWQNCKNKIREKSSKTNFSIWCQNNHSHYR